jgi:NAD(P)-dependent dehydrogenase (short-subunit alcohol dehydrogenase family)
VNATTTDLLKRIEAVSSLQSEDAPSELVNLTDELSRRRPYATNEYERFRAIQDRTLPSLPAALGPRLEGRSVVITGGTGCIGTALLKQLRQYGPARVTSIARGATKPMRPDRDTEYVEADIRDAPAVQAIFARVRPDIVFHLAAMRDPGRSQSQPVEAITTNINGTAVVLNAAIAMRTKQFVYASTGKAVRFYANEVYAATKLVGEAMVSAAGGEIAVGAARFTHVVDNSLILNKLKVWMHEDHMSLHDPYIAFYAQSATESAQLLLLGALNRLGEPRLYCLRDLGPYFELLDVALGMRQVTGSASAVTITGFPPGYQSIPHPAQYDPVTQDSVGPLFNSLEADRVHPVPDTAAFAMLMDTDVGSQIRGAVQAILALSATERASAPTLRRALDLAARQLTNYRFRAASEPQLRRLRQLAALSRTAPGTEQAIIDAALAHRPTPTSARRSIA